MNRRIVLIIAIAIVITLAGVAAGNFAGGNAGLATAPPPSTEGSTAMTLDRRITIARRTLFAIGIAGFVPSLTFAFALAGWEPARTIVASIIGG